MDSPDSFTTWRNDMHEEIHYVFTKTLAPGQIYRRGNHWFRVVRRPLPGVYIVQPFKPWGHR